jgi:hypothetical protein
MAASDPNVKLTLAEFDALRKAASGRQISENATKRLCELGLIEEMPSGIRVTGSGQERLRSGF